MTRHILDAAEAVEVGLIMLFTWVLTLIVPTICLIGLIDLMSRTEQRRPPGSAFEWWTAVGALIASSTLGLLCISATFGAFRTKDRPFGPAAAMRQLRLPVPLRIVPCAWWLGHFLLGAALLIPLERAMEFPSLRSGVAMGALALLASSVANVYLLLAVSALGKFPRALNALWRSRFLIDLLIALIVAFAGRR